MHFAKVAHVGGDVEVLLHSADRGTEPAGDLVEDQDSAVRVRQLLHRLQVAFGRQLGAHRLHHDRGDLALVLVQQAPERVQVALREGQRGPGERLRYADRPRAGDWEAAGRRVFEKVRGLVPVVPAVVAAEDYLVASGRAPGDPRRHGAGVAAALRVADHLRARDRVDQDLRELDLLRAVDREQAAEVDLLLHSPVDDVIGVAEDDRGVAVHPVDILVAVHVGEPRSLCAGGVARADALGVTAGAPALELHPARDQLARPLV